MLLRSLSYMDEAVDIGFFYELIQEIQKLRWYFYKFAKTNAEEAMQRTIMHAITHFDASKGNLSAYVKSLARDILKDGNRLVFVDFLENTISDDDDNIEVGQSGFARQKNSDFTTDLVNEMYLAEDKSEEIVCLSLEFMDKFVVLCEALLQYDTSIAYYPEAFINQSLTIMGHCTNFNEMCIALYLKEKERFEWFLSQGVDDKWREADFTYLSRHSSKKTKLINPDTGYEVEDADTDPFVLVKLESGKRLIRVNYYDPWDKLCDLASEDEGVNCIRFNLDGHFVIRTPAGSWSVLDCDPYSEYDLLRVEIITNIIMPYRGRLVHAGTENVYFLCNPDDVLVDREVDLMGIPAKFHYEDVTDLYWHPDEA